MNLFWTRIEQNWISFISSFVLNLLNINTLICDCPVYVYVNVFVYINIINTKYFIYYIIILFNILLSSISIVRKEWKGFKGKTEVWTVHAIPRYFFAFSISRFVFSKKSLSNLHKWRLIWKEEDRENMQRHKKVRPYRWKNIIKNTHIKKLETSKEKYGKIYMVKKPYTKLVAKVG